MRNIKLTLEYDGTNYHGFQLQKGKNLPTIQGILEDTLTKLTKEKVKIIGAGRTDAGVHAEEQVINFRTNWTIPIDRVPVALNSWLGVEDIVVLKAEEMGYDFHAIFCAKEKIYRYNFYHAQLPSAFASRYAWHLPYRLDLGAMRTALDLVEGTHDFAAFRSVGFSTKTSVRTIYEATWTQEDEWIRMTLRGNGFLYNMVRIIAGTLVKIGRGTAGPELITEMLETGDRNLGGKTAPPQGLFLQKVIY